MLPDRSFSELFGAEDAPDPVTHTRLRSPGERRVQARVPLEVDVVVATKDQFFSGISSDVSVGGIFVATHRAAALETGARLTLELTLPEGQVLARGVVRWTRAGADGVVPGVGVEFESLGEEDRVLLTKYCGSGARFYMFDENKAAEQN